MNRKTLVSVIRNEIVYKVVIYEIADYKGWLCKLSKFHYDNHRRQYSQMDLTQTNERP